MNTNETPRFNCLTTLPLADGLIYSAWRHADFGPHDTMLLTPLTETPVSVDFGYGKGRVIASSRSTWIKRDGQRILCHIHIHRIRFVPADGSAERDFTDSLRPLVEEAIAERLNEQ